MMMARRHCLLRLSRRYSRRRYAAVIAVAGDIAPYAIGILIRQPAIEDIEERWRYEIDISVNAVQSFSRYALYTR